MASDAPVDDGKPREPETPVKLHLYDISRGLAARLSPALIGKQVEGLWHVNVVVGDEEISYSPPLRRFPTGQSWLGNPSRVLHLGSTTLPAALREDLIRGLANTKYTIEAYNIAWNKPLWCKLHYSCTHFASEVAALLTGSEIPEYVVNQTQIWLESPLGEYLLNIRGQSGAPPPPPSVTPSTSTAPLPSRPAATPEASQFESIIRDMMAQAAGAGLVPGPPWAAGRTISNLLSLLHDAAAAFTPPAPEPATHPEAGAQPSPGGAGGSGNGRGEGDVEMEEGWTFLSRRFPGGSPPRTHPPSTQPAGQQQAAGTCGGAGQGQAGNGGSRYGCGWRQAGGCQPWFQGCPGQSRPQAAAGAQPAGSSQQNERVVFVPVPVIVPSIPALFAPFTLGSSISGGDLASVLEEVAWRMMSGAGRPPAPPGSCGGAACACGACTCRGAARAADPAPAPGSAPAVPAAQVAAASEGGPEQGQVAADGSPAAQEGMQM